MQHIPRLTETTDYKHSKLQSDLGVRLGDYCHPWTAVQLFSAMGEAEIREACHLLQQGATPHTPRQYLRRNDAQLKRDTGVLDSDRGGHVSFELFISGRKLYLYSHNLTRMLPLSQGRAGSH